MKFTTSCSNPSACALKGTSSVSVPPALAAIAAGRDHILTDEYAHAINRSSQTIRKNYCLKGDCFGIKPVKVGNRLLWPVAAIAALLQEAA